MTNKGSHQKSSASTGSQKPVGDRSCRNQKETKEGSLPDNHAVKSSKEAVQWGRTTHT